MTEQIDNGLTFVTGRNVGDKWSPTECPKCGRPLELELGTYYCHYCKIIIDPVALGMEEK